MQLAYRAAAAKYAEAAGLVAPFDIEQQWGFLLSQAGELLKQGDEFGDNAALIEAIDLRRGDLALAPRSERPLDWAKTQVNLGTALKVLGERESRDEAVAAYRKALKERTRERVPEHRTISALRLGASASARPARRSLTRRFPPIARR